MKRIPLSLLLIVGLAAAAEPPVTAPVLGHARIDSAVRPIYGIPGAAVLGPAADLGGAVTLTAAANEAGLVLAVLDDGRVMLYRGSAATPLDNAIASPTRIAVSPRGQAALLYSEQSDALQVITGLAGTPRVTQPIPLAWPVTAMAISDSGRALLAADGALWSAMPGRAPGHLMLADGVSAVAFFSGSNDLAFASGGTLWIRRSGELKPAGEAPGTIALQASGQKLFAATASTVSRIDLLTGARADLPCTCRITALEPLRGEGVFRLNSGGAEPLYIYDGEGADGRILFVPAPAVATDGGAQ